MKKLAVVLAVVVSGFVNGQVSNSKLDSSIIYKNYYKTYDKIMSFEYDSIMLLNIDDDSKLDKIQEFVEVRYNEILGSKYTIDCLAIGANDISVQITSLDYFDPNNPIFFATDKIGLFITNLNCIEESFRLHLLLNDIQDVFNLATY